MFDGWRLPLGAWAQPQPKPSLRQVGGSIVSIEGLDVYKTLYTIILATSASFLPSGRVPLTVFEEVQLCGTLDKH